LIFTFSLIYRSYHHSVITAFYKTSQSFCCYCGMRTISSIVESFINMEYCHSSHNIYACLEIVKCLFKSISWPCVFVSNWFHLIIFALTYCFHLLSMTMYSYFESIGMLSLPIFYFQFHSAYFFRVFVKGVHIVPNTPNLNV